MDISLINSESLALLSRMAGQELQKKDATPAVVFMASLLCVLMGVIYQDGKITPEERERWQTNLTRLIPPNSNLKKLVPIFTKYILFFRIYKNFNDLLLLMSNLSDSEKLLLIGFGYQMSASDGEIELREKDYLENLAHQINIDSRHIQIFESAFTNLVIEDQEALIEVHRLVDPAQFQLLDNIFVLAAKHIVEILPQKPRLKRDKIRVLPNYENLKQIQSDHQELDNICYQFYQIIAQDEHQVCWSKNLIDDLQEISKKNQSKRFRVTVVGEFSQGKSTFLNALVGEEIQPVREIPCTGVVSVLRYGEQKRVICCYKDGRKEDIPIENYQEKASISEEAAIGNLSDELADCKIEKIIFEHPDLDICSSGVEIIDSPGLNEHPDREAITQKILKDTDAAIFITSASRCLAKSERDVIEGLKLTLNSGLSDQPANNLFILVNFWDLVQTEKGRNQIPKRIEENIQGKNPIISGENRIHYISAKLALDAIVNNEHNEYIETFDYFINCLQEFLVNERGKLEVASSVNRIQALTESADNDLKQYEKILEGKIKISESAKLEIFEKIGEASGRDLRILEQAKYSITVSLEYTAESWNKWLEESQDRIAKKVGTWASEHSPFVDKEKVLQDYCEQFTQDLSEEIQNWIDNLQSEILSQQVKELNSLIHSELEAIRIDLQKLGNQLGTNLDEQFTSSMASNIRANNLGINSFRAGSKNNDEGGFNVLGGLGAGGLTAGALLGFVGLGFIPVLIVGGLAAVIGGFFFGGPNQDEVYTQCKWQVYDLGFKKFFESEEETFNTIIENIELVYQERYLVVADIIEQAIALYENLIEQQEEAHTKTLEEKEKTIVWINKQHQKLKNIQNELEAIVTEVTY
ncbi:dynamin family protein [Planktothrix agardhii]|uniref:dynamin family protein n=1 Tax=Planktothrix agardhii TaxID=1160 RepID=UPI00287687F2|nr:dynamin family protein [Planktothrix agardhii]MDS1346762.1 dynamin family protein [Planktothrix agardhii NRERC-751]